MGGKTPDLYAEYAALPPSSPEETSKRFRQPSIAKSAKQERILRGVAAEGARRKRMGA